MSKRKNDGEINEETRQKKQNDVDSKGIAVAVDVQNQGTPPPILKLNAICCDDLFEWLSLEDLHSLGQTCKRMQRLTGIYFQENFEENAYYYNQNITYNRIRINAFTKNSEKGFPIHRNEL